MNEDLILEIEELLDEAQVLMSEGDTTAATEKVKKAKKKLRPIGTGTVGPEKRP